MLLNGSLVFIIVFGSVYSSSEFSSCTSFHLKTQNYNKYLNGYNFSETYSPNLQECAKMCMSFSICKSFDYFGTKQICRFNSADSTSVHEHEFTRLSGAIFSDIADWPNDMAGGCGTRPCASHQRCVPHLEGHHELYGCIDTLNRDCKDILRNLPGTKSGQQTIFLLESKKTLSVYCEMETDGGGWTVFQRRLDGKVDFYRNYTEYVNGFGTVSGDFWLGLKNIQELANLDVSELRIDIASIEGTTGYERFEEFKLVDPEYTLQLHSTIENSGPNGMLFNNNSGFSTFDHDVDKASSYNCASDRKGAWWYRSCSHMNLNGLRSTISPCMRHNGLAFQECLHSSRLMFRRTT